MTHARPSLFALLSLTLASAGPAAAQPAAAGAGGPASTTSPPAAPGTLASALDAARTTDYARAERELTAITGSDRPTARVALARIMLEQGRYADAEKYATQAAATPMKLQALALRARALDAAGKAAEGIRLLDPQKDAPGPGGRAVRLVLGSLLIETGRRADAETVLKKFADEYNNTSDLENDAEGLAELGRAMDLIRYWKSANTAFNESEQVDKARIETLLWRASLFLEKQDTGHAEEVLREVLKIGPKNADALVLMARVKLAQTMDFDAAEKLVADALAVNPKHTGAFAVRAGLALRDMDLVKADQAVTDGLAVNPNELELLSLRAAVRFLADDRAGYEQAKKDVLRRNGQYSQFFTTVGEFAEWEHRYDDIVKMMTEATKLDPDDSSAWAELGLTEMRNGDETGGMKAIEEAWKNDHYNVQVFNTLNMYEKEIPNRYDTGTEGVFKIRYPKDEEKLLERYVPAMLGEAWGAMKMRYMFAPTVPVAIELYATRQNFAVRTSGLPNIGIEGVCFGHVVASMSPASEPFNWGNVLWHELGHVFAIQLSKNHVPRWFTEGLSEYETIVRRPEWQRELDPELYAALVRGALPSAVDMNRAFTHASDELDVSVAYYAASQMIVFTAEEFGMPKIVEALKAWGEGLRTPDVIQRAFGVSPSEYDARYRAWEGKRLARYKGQFMFHPHPRALDDAKVEVQAHPDSAAAHVGLALALLRAKKIDEAKGEIDAALKIDANDMDAHFLASKLAEGNKDADEMARHLLAIRRAGGDGYTVEMALADVAEARKDKRAMRAALEAANRFDPTQSEALKGMFDLAKEEKRDGDALEALRKLARLEQHDRQVWKLLLERLVAAKRWDEAAKVGEGAVFVDVERPGTHIDYARALGALGDHGRATFELESALLCNPKPPDAATAHALLARESLALGDTASARNHLAEALRLDPQNADALGLKIP